MKKLSLIIPPSKPISTYFIHLNLLILLVLSAKSNSAQTYGCHVLRGMSDVLYDTPYGIGSPYEWLATGTIDVTGTQGGFHYDAGSFGCIQDIGDVCIVYQQYEISYGPPQIVGVRPYKTGVFAGMQPSNCPIDDYIPSFFIFTAFIVFFKMKRKALLADQ